MLEEFDGEALAGAKRLHGDVRVNRQIVGFKKIKFYTMENVGAGKLNMPEQEMHTTSFWLHFPAAFLARFAEYTPTEKQSGISGLGNALPNGSRAAADVRSAHDLGVALSEESRAAARRRSSPTCTSTICTRAVWAKALRCIVWRPVYCSRPGN